MPIRDIHDVEAMAQLDVYARQKLEVPESIADAFIGDVFSSGGSGIPDASFATLAIEAGRAIEGDGNALVSLFRRAITALKGDLSADKPRRNAFHWPLQFPEVFVRPIGGFDAIVGNPPFLGGRQMPGKLGVLYPTYLRAVYEVSGPADLVCFFFRRVGIQIIRNGGCFGLIGTNSISETVNSEAALKPILDSGAILFRAHKSVPWPGSAAVTIAMIFGVQGVWSGERLLDGESVQDISHNLDAAGHGGEIQIIGPKFPSSQGVNLFGQAFVVDGNKIESLKRTNPGLAKSIRVFVNGDVLNDSPLHNQNIFVVDFGERNETEIVGCDEMLSSLSEKVSFERRNQTRQVHEHRPWLHWDKRTRFLETARQRTHFFALTIVSAYFVVHRVPTESLYAHGVQLFDSDSASDFAIIQSSAHEYWARFNSGSLGQTLRYTASKCWSTLPWPESISIDTAEIADQLLMFRAELMARRRCGSNQIYAEFHDPAQQSSEIVRLRRLHETMDFSVMNDYGWSDLDTSYRSLNQGKTIRLSISEQSRRELISRLLLLNRSRALLGVKETSRKPTRTRLAAVSSEQSVFAFEKDSIGATDAYSGASAAILDYLDRKPGWHAKAEILAATGTAEGQWKAAIDELIGAGKIERQGEKRGARYRIQPGKAS
jgi:hypothetical protein